ncbi:MAG: hypothetical protein K0R84_1444, partial [Clostridia bacterium]|nr:hypothetical protein [Clostridia bacterium]
MKKILSLIMCLLLIVSLFSGAGMARVDAGTIDEGSAANERLYDGGRRVRENAENPELMAKEAARMNAMEDELGAAEAAETESTFENAFAVRYFQGYDPIFGSYPKQYTLRSIGENVEIWVANDLAFYKPVFDDEGHWIDEVLDESRPTHIVTQAQVDWMRDNFDSRVYPKDVEFFGMPDSHTGEYGNYLSRYSDTLGDLINYKPESYIPEGYEVKERVAILIDNIRDERYYIPQYPNMIVGFYSPNYEAAFDRNIISIDSADWDTLLETNRIATTAHEFQHLIHDDNDPAEESWINEGMSDYAEYLCLDLYNWGHINYYLEHPENSLVEWDDQYDSAETIADYGQALLMQIYLNDKYGQDFVKALALDGEDQGINSMNKILAQFDTGIDFEELFRRFTIATAIDSDAPGNGMYQFNSIDINVNYESALTFNKDGVPAWGADYKALDFTDKIDNIKIDGVEFMPTPWRLESDPLGSGNTVLWGNNGDYRDNQLLLQADLTGLNTATLSFDNYISIEENWDAGAVQVSTDNGETWISLANEHTTAQADFPPNDQAMYIYNNLPGFTGYYEEWTKETFDLSEYAGQKILINFRYMTDAAYNDDGWFIDNIEIPEIGYVNDCSSLDGFLSIDEAKQVKVEYAITFINKKEIGQDKAKYSILSIDPATFTED